MSQVNHRIVKRTINASVCVLMLLLPLVSNGSDGWNIHDVRVSLGKESHTHCFNEKLEFKHPEHQNNITSTNIGLLILNVVKIDGNKSWLPLVPFGINKYNEQRPFLLGHAPRYDDRRNDPVNHSRYLVSCNKITNETQWEKIPSINDKYASYYKLYLDTVNFEQIRALQTNFFNEKTVKLILPKIKPSNDREFKKLMTYLVDNVPESIWKEISEQAKPSIPALQMSEDFWNNKLTLGNQELNFSEDINIMDQPTLTPPSLGYEAMYSLTLPDGLEKQHIESNDEDNCKIIPGSININKLEVNILQQTNDAIQAHCVLQAGALSFNLTNIVEDNNKNIIDKVAIKEKLYLNKQIKVLTPSGYVQEIQADVNFKNLNIKDIYAPSELEDNQICGLLPEKEILKNLMKNTNSPIYLYKKCKVYLFNTSISEYFTENDIKKLDRSCNFFEKGEDKHAEMWYCFAKNAIPINEINLQSEWWQIDSQSETNKSAPVIFESLIKPTAIKIEGEDKDYKIAKIEYCLNTECKSKSSQSIPPYPSLEEIRWTQTRLPEKITIHYKLQSGISGKKSEILIEINTGQPFKVLNFPETTAEYQYSLAKRLDVGRVHYPQIYWYSTESECLKSINAGQGNLETSSLGSEIFYTSQEKRYLDADPIKDAIGPEDVWAVISWSGNAKTKCTQGKTVDNEVHFSFELIERNVFTTFLILDPAKNLEDHSIHIKGAFEELLNSLQNTDEQVIAYRVLEDGRLNKWLDTAYMSSSQREESRQKLQNIRFDNEYTDIFPMLSKISKEVNNINEKRIIYITDGSDSDLVFDDQYMGTWLGWMYDGVPVEVITLDCNDYWHKRARLPKNNCLSLKTYTAENLRNQKNSNNLKNALNQRFIKEE